MILTKEQIAEFQVIARPLMKFLAENFNPHTSVILDSTRADIVSCSTGFVTDEYIKD